MLTKKALEGFAPGHIFATGEIQDGPFGIYMMRTGKQLRWVACRGDIPDWAIYCHTSDKSPDWVKSYGDKVHDRANIQRLMPCNEEALALYRD